MIVLNEFLYEICVKSDGNSDMYRIIIDFLELDTDDKRIHGSAVIKTVRQQQKKKKQNSFKKNYYFPV